ncbi:MAG TPA: DUF5715 family protein [Acidobacteriaceae bacterium]|nr:DUF5715 family protein [Acidobacteriaceae bacterium]
MEAVASTHRSGIYASGESRPPGDERLSMSAGDKQDSTLAPTGATGLRPDANEISSRQSSTSDEQTSSEIDDSADSDSDDQAADLAKLSSRPSQRELAEEAVQPRMLPIYSRSGHLIVPPPLRGSREILVHQNAMADAAGLERIRNDRDLKRLRSAHRLVNLTTTASLHVNPELPPDRRCARLWTVRFAADIARAYYAQFGEPLELNSAVRTISYQRRLERVNGNAAAVAGDTASPHLTGQAIDFGKRGMSLAEIAWMRAYLLPLMQAGAIDVEEEFQQACFHISVYRSYLADRELPRHRFDVAQK